MWQQKWQVTLCVFFFLRQQFGIDILTFEQSIP